MATSLHYLTDALMWTLGRHSRQEYLRQMLRDCGMDDAALLRAGGERPYAVAWPDHGLVLQVQSIVSPDAPPENCSWGLHSITFEAANWRGPWPGRLNPESATVDDWLKALPGGLGVQTEIVRTPELVCLTLPGRDSQTWSVVAVFNPTARLQSLTFARAGDWVAASIVSPWPAVEAQ